MEIYPTFGELLEAYRKGEVEPKGWYTIYWTELHRKDSSLGFVPGDSLPYFEEAMKSYMEHEERNLLWGNKRINNG